MFAEENVQISDGNKKIIYHARKSLTLFNEDRMWMKKNRLFM